MPRVNPARFLYTRSGNPFKSMPGGGDAFFVVLEPMHNDLTYYAP